MCCAIGTTIMRAAGGPEACSCRTQANWELQAAPRKPATGRVGGRSLRRRIRRTLLACGSSKLVSFSAQRHAEVRVGAMCCAIGTTIMRAAGGPEACSCRMQANWELQAAPRKPTPPKPGHEAGEDGDAVRKPHHHILLKRLLVFRASKTKPPGESAHVQRKRPFPATTKNCKP